MENRILNKDPHDLHHTSFLPNKSLRFKTAGALIMNKQFFFFQIIDFIKFQALQL